VQRAEQATVAERLVLDEIQVLLGALRVLGLEAAAQSFTERVSALKQRLPN